MSELGGGMEPTTGISGRSSEQGRPQDPKHTSSQRRDTNCIYLVCTQHVCVNTVFPFHVAWPQTPYIAEDNPDPDLQLLSAGITGTCHHAEFYSVPVTQPRACCRPQALLIHYTPPSCCVSSETRLASNLQ